VLLDAIVGQALVDALPTSVRDTLASSTPLTHPVPIENMLRGGPVVSLIATQTRITSLRLGEEKVCIRLSESTCIHGGILNHMLFE